MATPGLTAVQCESCHGNGAAHSRDPKVRTDTQARFVCRECHTVDQTPDFEFESFWAKVANCDKVSVAMPASR
jgi:predicted CXXCH cytochrome family protein